MPYCTEADITNIEITRDELIALTDDDKVGKVNSARVSAAIEKADTEIDSYCSGKYTVPFSPVPAEIKFLSATIAAYWLWRRRQSVSDSILDKYTKALSRLKAISDGLYTLQGATIKDSSGIGSTVESTAKQTFTRSRYDADGNLIGNAGSTEVW